MLNKNQFPSRTEQTRIKTLEKFESLYENEQRQVLPLHDIIQKQYKNPADIIYLAHAIPAKISDFYADFVHGDIDRMTFDFVGNDNEKSTFEEITKTNEVAERIHDWATEQSIAGYTALLGYKGTDGKFYIQEVEQDQYFPQDDGSVIFATYFRDTSAANPAVIPEEAPLRLYTQQYSLSGEDVMIERAVWSTDVELKNAENLGAEVLKKFFDVEPIEKIEGIGRLPIVQIDNGRRTRWGFGKSDYADVIPQIAEINEGRTHVATQLLKNLDAKLELPLNEDMKNGDGSLAHFEYIMRPDNDTPQTRYITNENPLIEATEVHITSQLKMISYVTDVPMWALNDSAAPEKVESMKIKLFGAIRRTNRKRAKIKKGLEEIYKIGFKMLGKEMGDGKLLIEFSNVLPNDEFVDAQTEQVKVEAGITSKRSAMRRLENYTEEELDEEEKLIAKEGISSGAVDPNVTPTL